MLETPAEAMRRLIGRLAASGDAAGGELERFETALATALHDHPDLAIDGNWLPIAADEPNGSAASSDDTEFTGRLSRIEGLLAGSRPGAATNPRPRLFRRETAFRADLLGHSVPDWGLGSAPAESFGPFVDELGQRLWFDLFRPIELVSIGFAGAAASVLRLPMRRRLVDGSSFTIAAGSAWIASDLIARVAVLGGHYTGLKVAGGHLELSQPATVSGGQVILAPATLVTLHLDLAKRAAVPVEGHAGADADAPVELPQSLDLSFQLNASSLDAGVASCTVFGCATRFARTAAPPVWLAALNRILVPFGAVTDAQPGDTFEIQDSRSQLCKLGGRATIDAAATGWLLPATPADPQSLGAAAGSGALCIALGSGLHAQWTGLNGPTNLVRPAVVVEPGLISVSDFTASNIAGQQRWKLWRNAANPHDSDIVLSFGSSFAFVFITSAADSEGVFCFCNQKAAIDRPVDANGRPFAVASSGAFAATLLTGERRHAVLIDNDLLLDGAPVTADDLRHYPLALRNALFDVSRPRRLVVVGELAEGRMTSGVLALTHDIHRYLPTLPDPYVASYTHRVRDPAANVAGRPPQSLTGFVKWPDAEHPLVFYKFTPLLEALPAVPPAKRNFRNGVGSFNRSLVTRAVARGIALPTAVIGDLPPRRSGLDPVRLEVASQTGELRAAIADLAAHPLLAQRTDTAEAAERTLRTAQAGGSDAGRFGGRAQFGHDLLMLLDVSTRADHLGVTLGPPLDIRHDAAGNAVVVAGDAEMQLLVMNMDVVASVRHLRAATLPQLSWEPVFNIPLASAPPGDTVTTTPGLLVAENDGIPTRFFSESPYLVPVAPLPAVRHIIDEYHDRHTPRAVHAVFTLPFGMVAQAEFSGTAQLGFHMPHFHQLRGGWQLAARPPKSPSPKVSPSFPGWTVQLDNLRWGLFGVPLSGTMLGGTVASIFNPKFQRFGTDPKVPLERIDFSGYGASIFSDWRDATATIADVSQVQFDALMGRTAHEVVQVRSILYPFGVHVVRTITLMRSNNGYVFRSDSGWVAESDGCYDFDYKIDLEELGTKDVIDPYEIHKQPVRGVSNVREIRDFPDVSPFTGSFRLDDPELPPVVRNMTQAEWNKVFKNLVWPNPVLPVQLNAVLFDADVHLDNVVGGSSGPGSVVQSRKMLGFVQVAPSSILLPSRLFADLLRYQNGSLGGPVDCIIDIAKSQQRMRVQRVDVNPAFDAAGKSVFVSAARGSLVLPADGAWSVVRQQVDTGDVAPLPPQEGVPLIKPNASANYLIAHPADVHLPKSNARYGIVQSTGTQKLLFDVPQITPGVAKLKSAQTFFADAYKLLNSKGPFPNVANALGLTAAERELDILGEGVMKLADRQLDLGALLPATYTYPFVDLPDVLRIYAQYKNSGGADAKLDLGIDSLAAADKRWKAALSSMRVIVDLGPFKELMWVDGNFDAASGASPAYNKPHLQFGPDLQPVVEILQLLAELSGEEFDRGMSVGMSNAADSWEYKLSLAKEIPVIHFPSPLQLSLNPNPPLKLEAGLRVGFYFNMQGAAPTDLKQLVPSCGAFVEFYGSLQVQCFTLGVASIYAVGRVTLGISADTKSGKPTVYMKYGFGAEIVVGLPVVANVAVLYMVSIEVSIGDDKLLVAGLLMFRGSAEICGGLVAVGIQIEAGGSVARSDGVTTLTAQVTFTVDVCLLWVIDIDVTEHWQEQRQIG